MSSTICFNLGQSKILSSSNGLKRKLRTESQNKLNIVTVLYTLSKAKIYDWSSLKLELSQSAAYPHTAPCNRTGVIFLKKNHGSGSTPGKIITYTKGINFENSWNIIMVLVRCTCDISLSEDLSY